MTIVYSPQARLDQSRIWAEAWQRFGEEMADAYAERFEKTLRKMLGVFPGAGRPRPEFGPDVRSLPIVPYVAFYRVKNRRVTVLRIVHGHSDLSQPILSLLVAI